MTILEYQLTQAYYPINDVGTILLGSNINLYFFDEKKPFYFAQCYLSKSIFGDNVYVMLQKFVVHKDTNITFNVASECRIYLYESDLKEISRYKLHSELYMISYRSQ